MRSKADAHSHLAEKAGVISAEDSADMRCGGEGPDVIAALCGEDSATELWCRKIINQKIS
jgi:hypothetical protein